MGSQADPNENGGEGYGGDRPGIAVAPKASVKQAIGPDETPETMRKKWDEEAPHFGGGMPHRWDDDAIDEKKVNNVAVLLLQTERLQTWKPDSSRRTEEIRKVMGSKSKTKN